MRNTPRVSRWKTVLAAGAVLVATQDIALAQNYSFDARKIALGGIGGDLDNVASTMIDEQRPYGSVVMPLGLIQLFGDFKQLNPANDEFDPVRTFEYAASPIHYINKRGSGITGDAFIVDLVNGRISDDLSRYSGFAIAEHLSAEGLAAPNWGGTIKVHKRGNGFQGIYVGAGPYMAFRTALDVDGQLRDLLAGNIAQIPNASLRLDNSSDGQLAAAITGGYRARFPLPGGTANDRDGLYVGVNYHHLRGFQYRAFDTRVRFDTDAIGYVIDPAARTLNLQFPEDPIVFDSRTSTSGSGFATDFGVGAVVRRWEFGFGANGIANRIDWTDFERTRYSMPSILDGGDFVEQSLTPEMTTLRTELPVSYSSNLGYHQDNWSAMGDVTRGFNGTSLHLGYERRLGAMELRGGGRYSREKWHPSAGVGFNLNARVGLDVAAFSTAANIQQKERMGVAVSFRFNRIP